MRLKINIVLKQAARLLSSAKPSVADLKTSEANLLLALNDPDLNKEERTEILAALRSIQRALRDLGEKHIDEPKSPRPI